MGRPGPQRSFKSLSSCATATIRRSTCSWSPDVSERAARSSWLRWNGCAGCCALSGGTDRAEPGHGPGHDPRCRRRRDIGAPHAIVAQSDSPQIDGTALGPLDPAQVHRLLQSAGAVVRLGVLKRAELTSATLLSSAANTPSPKPTRILVSLERRRGKLGIQMAGGAEAGSTRRGIFVKKVYPGGVAAEDGQLQRGDRILQARHSNLAQLTCNRLLAGQRHQHGRQAARARRQDSQGARDACPSMAHRVVDGSQSRATAGGEAAAASVRAAVCRVGYGITCCRQRSGICAVAEVVSTRVAAERQLALRSADTSPADRTAHRPASVLPLCSMVRLIE